MSQDKPAASAAPGAAPAEKKVQAFYSKATDKNPISIWVTTKTKAGSPDFDGTIGEKRVAGYIHKGPKAGFISFIDSKAGKGADGNFSQIATANVVVNAAGIPKLAIKMVGQKEAIWAECSLKVSQDMLVSAGLDVNIQATKKAEAAAKKAAGKPAESAAT